jgi:hypothetical protein
VQCCSVASDVAAVRIFAFFHPTEGTDPYWEQITAEARPRSSTLPPRTNATAHAMDIGAIAE